MFYKFKLQKKKLTEIIRNENDKHLKDFMIQHKTKLLFFFPFSNRNHIYNITFNKRITCMLQSKSKVWFLVVF